MAVWQECGDGGVAEQQNEWITAANRRVRQTRRKHVPALIQAPVRASCRQAGANIGTTPSFSVGLKTTLTRSP
ncbi:MAG: hypothetical protein ACRYG5_03200, partial [Janthinobacterium lividum]